MTGPKLISIYLQQTAAKWVGVMRILRKLMLQKFASKRNVIVNMIACGVNSVKSPHYAVVLTSVLEMDTAVVVFVT